MIAFLADQPAVVADLREPQVGIVLPQRETVLRARGHHAVGLVRPLGDKVVDEHADVRLGPPQDEGGLAAQL